MENKFIFWGVTTLIVGSLSIIGILIRTLWTTVFRDFWDWKKSVQDWRTSIEQAGGVTTRDKHFSWCGEKQGSCSEKIGCRLDDIEQWRQDMYEKGGPLMAQAHEAICDRVTSKAANIFSEKIETSLAHHRELQKKDLEIVMAGMKSTVLDAVEQIKKMNGTK